MFLPPRRPSCPAPHRAAFTLIELLVVVSIIGLLVSILLPAVTKARDQARLTLSQSNLRNIGVAAQAYAAEWADRQFSLADDNLATYGKSSIPAMDEYIAQHGGLPHAPPALGWGYDPEEDIHRLFQIMQIPPYPLNYTYVQPIVFTPLNGIVYSGSFRLINARQFNAYVAGRFFDPVFYAPKDRIVMDVADECFDDPGEFCVASGGFTWSSYVLSPAAMLNPQVLGAGCFKDPWSLGGGFRAPAMSQARYSNLKSHVMEHHWLQNARGPSCNPAFSPGTYDGCEPFYFNASTQSSPVTLFYDGHIEGLGMSDVLRADGRLGAQGGGGLWSRTTPWGPEGYYSEAAFESVDLSPHILTTDGIRGRDITD